MVPFGKSMSVAEARIGIDFNSCNTCANTFICHKLPFLFSIKVHVKAQILLGDTEVNGSGCTTFFPIWCWTAGVYVDLCSYHPQMISSWTLPVDNYLSPCHIEICHCQPCIGQYGYPVSATLYDWFPYVIWRHTVHSCYPSAKIWGFQICYCDPYQPQINTSKYFFVPGS